MGAGFWCLPPSTHHGKMLHDSLAVGREGSAMPQISLEWDTVKHAYPMRPLTGALKAFMDHTPGTPCCVQMSHALGVAGCTIGTMSNRRRNSTITTPSGTRNYLLAVDEMNWYLKQNFGMGEEISKGDNGKRRLLQEMTDVL